MKSRRICEALNTVTPTERQKARMRRTLSRELERRAAPEATKRAKRAAQPRRALPRQEPEVYTVRQIPRRKFAWVPTAAAVVLLLGAGLGMLHLLALRQQGQPLAAPTQITTQATSETTAAAAITLDSLADRAEYQAQREWLDYRSTAKAGADSSGLSEAYQSYGCKDSADAQMLDALISAYGLTMGIWENAGSLTMQEQADAQLAADKIGNLSALVEEGSPAGAIRSQDTSSSDFSGDACIVGTVESSSIWEYPVRFELYFNTADSFSPFFPLMGSTEDYESWSYTTSSYVSLALGLGEDSAVIYCPAENGFYLVYTEAIRVGDVQTGEHTMTREQLEAFAETFQFPQVSSESRTAAGEKRYAEALSRWQAVAEGENTGCAEARSTAMGLGQGEYGYIFRELDGDGIDELIITDGVKVFALYTGGDNIPLIVDTEAFSYYLTDSGYVTQQQWLDASQRLVSFHFYRLKEAKLDLVEGVSTTDITGQTYERIDSSGARTAITSVEYDEIIAFYHFAELKYKPLSDYAG